jgi:hypothetical protein
MKVGVKTRRSKQCWYDVELIERYLTTIYQTRNEDRKASDELLVTENFYVSINQSASPFLVLGRFYLCVGVVGW